MSQHNAQSVRGRHRAMAVARRWTVYGVVLTLAAAVTVVITGSVVASHEAHAASSASEQWPTAVSTPSGGSRTFTFAGGVTATETNTATTGTCSMSAAAAVAPSGANLATYWEPDPPATTFTTSSSCTASTGDRKSTVTFNKPVIDPILHVENLDASKLTVGGNTTAGSAITLTTLASNSELEVAGNSLNSTLAAESNTGCQITAGGTNGNGGCGSIQLNGEVKSFTLDNNAAGGTGTDNWQMTLSYPTVSLTKAFTPSTIGVGDLSQLVFTIANPGNSTQPTLSPIDFTDTFVNSLTLDDGNITTNGNCGTPTYLDPLGGTPAWGTSTLQVTGVSVAANSTCTITVDVSTWHGANPGPTGAGSYANNSSNLTSTVANLTLSNANATLNVSGLDCGGPAVYGIDLQTLGLLWIGPTGLMRQVGTIFATAFDTNANALAANPSGTTLYIVQGALNTSGTGITEFNVATGAVSTFGGPTEVGSGLHLNEGGAVDPLNNIYYFGDLMPSSTINFYGFNTVSNTPIAGLVAKLPFASGDLVDFAFDESGNMYLEAEVGTTTTYDLLRISAASIPSTATGATLTATVIGSAIDTGETASGLAFDGSGNLELVEGALGSNTISEVNPSSGALGNPSELSYIGFNGAPYTGDVDDLTSCGAPSTLALQKNVASRFAPGDQFTVSITGNGLTAGAAGNTGVTSGTALGVQSASSEVAGPVLTPASTTYTLTEAGSNGANLANYSTTYSCVNTVTGTTVLGPSAGTSFTYTTPATQPSTGNDIVCTFTNAPLGSLTLNKSIAARVNSADQFTVGVANGTTSLGSQTTTGSGTSVQATVGPVAVVQGTTYTLTDAMAAGSASSASAYSATIACTDTTTATAATVTGSAPSWSLTVPNGDNYSCTITNTPAPLTCNNTIYVFNGAGATGEIYAVNTATGASTPVGPVWNGAGTGDALGIASGGATAYVASGSGTTLLAYNTATQAYTALSSTSETAVPTAGAVDPVNGWYYYAAPASGGAVYAWNPATPAAAAIEVGVWPATALASTGDIDFDADGNGYLLSGGTLYRFTTPTAAGTATIALTAIRTGLPTTNVTGFALGSDGYLYIALKASTNNLQKWDPNSGATAVSSMTISGTPLTAIQDAAGCMDPPVLSATKVLPNGRFASADQFQLTLNGDGLSAPNNPSWSTAGSGSTITGTPAWEPVVAGNSYSVTESGATTTPATNLADYTTTYSCVDTVSGTMIASGSGATTASFTIPAAAAAGQNIVCTFTNTPLASLTLNKSVPTRVNPSDQFTVAIQSGATVLGSATTSGTGTGLQATAIIASSAGTTYQLTDSMAAGSANSISAYTPTIGCSDTTTSAAISVTGSAPSWSLTVPNSDNYACTITNTPAPLSCTNTIYAFNGTGAAGQLYAVNTQTGASTAVGPTWTGTGTANALGISDNGLTAYLGQGSGNALRTYDVVSGTYSNLAATTQVAVPTMGAVDPLNGWFYFTAAGNGAAVYAYNPPTSTTIEVGTLPASVGAVNGDLDFDQTGNGYLLENGTLYRFAPPTATSTSVITLTQLRTGLPTTNVSGFAFGNDGYLYVTLNASSANLQRWDPDSGASAVSSLTISGTPLTAIEDAAGCMDPPVLSAVKTLPTGRFVGTDEFKLTLGGDGISTANTLTTTGAATGLQPLTAGPLPVVAGTSGTYAVTEAVATTTPATNLANYAVSYRCVDTISGTTVASGSGTVANVSTATATAAGQNIVCTFTNTPLSAPTIVVSKALGSNRAATNDQFSVVIRTGGVNGTPVTVSGNSTTQGSGASVTTNTGTTGTFTATAGTAYTVTEAAANGTNLAAYTATIGCTDANGVQAALPSAGTAFDPAAGLTITAVGGAAISCTITNTAAAPTLTLSKALSGNRFSNGDEFTVAIMTGPTVVNSLAASTTQGSGSSITGGTGTTGPTTAAAGTAYALSETAASGSLSDYTATIGCTDANGIQTSGLPVAGTAYNPAAPPTVVPVAGAAISCVITNTAIQVASLTLAKTASAASVSSAGAVVTFTYSVTNTGNLTLNPVSINETSFTGTPALNVSSCSSGIGSLAPGVTGSCVVSYVVTQADLDRGSLTNTASAVVTPPTGPGTSSPSSQVTIPVSATDTSTLVKTASVANISSVGQVVTFTFAVTNTGHVTESSVAIDETSFSGSPAVNVAGCPSQIGRLAPGASAQCTSTYAVTSADISNGDLTNSAVAIAIGGGGGASASNQSSVTLTPRTTHLASTGVDSQVELVGAALLLVCGALLMLAAAGRRTRRPGSHRLSTR